jgi:50S ribosomal protein L16 3-hydroxylase
MEVPMSSAGSTLQQLIGSENLTSFLAAWPERSFLVHAPAARLAEIDTLPELADWEALFRAMRGASDVMMRAWFRTVDGGLEQIQVTPGEAARLYRSGTVTIVIDGIANALPAVGQLMQRLRVDLKLPKCDLSCSAYVSPPGVGSRMHFDEQENFFLQLRGEKHWRIHRNEQMAFPSTYYWAGSAIPNELGAAGRDFPQTMPETADDVTLSPGSVLFVPRGYWHESSTRQHSLALTLTFRSWTWREVLLLALSRRLLRDTAWRRPLVARDSLDVTCLLAEGQSMCTEIERLLERDGLSDEIGWALCGPEKLGPSRALK